MNSAPLHTHRPDLKPLAPAPRRGGAGGGGSAPRMPSAQAAPAGTASTVLVYNGEGAGLRSVRSAVESIAAHVTDRAVQVRRPPEEQLAGLPPEVPDAEGGPARSQVRTINTAELLAGRWQPRCRMLVMPGGADLPYVRRLAGPGNALIRGGMPRRAAPRAGAAPPCRAHAAAAALRARPASWPPTLHAHPQLRAPADYVLDGGGAYLGLCAGAYYACASIEFDRGGPLQVAGPRELRLFAGSARGPAYEGAAPPPLRADA
jgi:hypothetical protein